MLCCPTAIPGMTRSSENGASRWACVTLEDALTIRRRVFGAFEMAETATDPAERRRWLSFALVGGGPTGVELPGQIREMATETLTREFCNIAFLTGYRNGVAR